MLSFISGKKKILKTSEKWYSKFFLFSLCISILHYAFDTGQRTRTIWRGQNQKQVKAITPNLF